jgi:hypothetical protein
MGWEGLMGLYQRMKGKRVERAVAELIRRVFPDAKRGFQSRAGTDQCDIEGTPYWFEIKGGKCPNPRAALKQAIEDTDGRTPVVVVKDDRCEPFVVMRLSDWLEDLWQPDALLEKPAEEDDDAQR